MLIYRHPDVTTPPDALLGAPNLVHWGDCWWSGSSIVRPDREALVWRECPNGWRVAIHGDQPEDAVPAPRSISWSLVIPVRDARDRVWMMPALLTPSGDSAIAQVGRLDCHTGEWAIEEPNPRAGRALESARAARAAVETGSPHDFGEWMEWTAAVVEAAYHVDAVTLGILGLIDTVLVHQGLRSAAGLIHQESIDAA